MKTGLLSYLRLALAASLALCAASCALPRGKTGGTAAKSTTPGKASKVVPAEAADEHDDYAVVEVADPLERVNRGIFWFNDKAYNVVLRPISKGYQFVLPKPVRRSIDNAFENVKFPVRFVNSALQGKFKRAGKETGKFFVNTFVGVGGLMNISDKVPALANVPTEDTGQTFAVWGMGHGAYLMLPIMGPTSVRDGVGLIGDYALNPVNWGVFYHGGHDWEHDWTSIPPSANTLRSLPAQLETYDATTRDAVDPYISVRSAYIQARSEAAKK